MKKYESPQFPPTKGVVDYLERYLAGPPSEPRMATPEALNRQKLLLQTMKQPGEAVVRVKQLAVGSKFVLIYIFSETEIERRDFAVKQLVVSNKRQVLEVHVENAKKERLVFEPDRPVIIKVK